MFGILYCTINANEIWKYLKQENVQYDMIFKTMYIRKNSLVVENYVYDSKDEWLILNENYFFRIRLFSCQCYFCSRIKLLFCLVFVCLSSLFLSVLNSVKYVIFIMCTTFFHSLHFQRCQSISVSVFCIRTKIHNNRTQTFNHVILLTQLLKSLKVSLVLITERTFNYGASLASLNFS